jgi:hypothetical protein
MEGVSRYPAGWMSHSRLWTPEAVQGLDVIDAHVRRRARTNNAPVRAKLRCAVYTRKSSQEVPEQEFNSLDAHPEAFPPPP